MDAETRLKLFDMAWTKTGDHRLAMAIAREIETYLEEGTAKSVVKNGTMYTVEDDAAEKPAAE